MKHEETIKAVQIVQSKISELKKQLIKKQANNLLTGLSPIDEEEQLNKSTNFVNDATAELQDIDQEYDRLLAELEVTEG
jgi:hypothetical protein